MANQAPTAIQLSNTVVEADEDKVLVGAITVTDPDSDTTFQFDLSDSRFEVKGLPGAYELWVKDDAEVSISETNVPLTITAHDPGGLTFSQSFTLSSSDLENEDEDEVHHGGGSDDAIHGHGGNDLITGGNGNDDLFGEVGDDSLDGGNGNDRLHGGDNDDRLTGAAGNDDIFGDTGDDSIDGGKGDDHLHGGDDDDLLIGNAGNDTMDGDSGTDVLRGGKGDDVINGGDDNDQLRGEDGNDTLSGGNGNDLLIGDKGNDRLDGGAGNDALTGGNNKDVFVFSDGYGQDTITDYREGIDQIDLSGRTDVNAYADIQALMTVQSGDVHIHFANNDELIIKSVSIAELNQHTTDFLF